MEPNSPGHEPPSDAAATGANAALSARVTALLPEAWRAGARVAPVPGGFVAALRDAAGVEHALRADWQEAGFHALAHGRRFCLSYLAGADGPDDAAGLARFHEAAHALLADEDPLAALTRAADGLPAPAAAAPAAPRGFDLSALPAAGDALAAWVTARLPEGWREGARVALAPGGFAVGAPDDAGRWRVLRARELEPGFAGLAQGRHFDFSYLTRDGEADDAAAVAQYRALAEALRAQEDQIADDLHAPPERLAEDLRAAAEARSRANEPAPPPAEAPPVVVEAPPPGFDASALPGATAALTARVTALLPAAWRAGARVARTPGGFVVESRDAAGAAAALRADWQEAGFHALAHGRRFCLSYLGPADAAALTRFHEAAHGLLADEGALAGFTRATGASDPLKAGEVPAGPGFDLAAWPAAGEGLAAWAAARLPAGWREGARVALTPGGFAAGWREPSGQWRVVRAREVEPGFAALAQGRHFDFSFLEGGDAAAVAQYRALAEALRAQEDALAEDLYPSGFGGARVGLDLLAQPSPGEQLTARVRALLPADWREDVRVARANGGFVAGFREASGARHVLRARWLEGAMVAVAYGRRFAFSAPAADADGAAAGRALAGEILAREDSLAEALRTSRQVRGFDRFGPPPTNAALSAWLGALPPAEGRAGLEAVQSHDGFALRFRDAAGAPHVLRAHWLEEEFPVVAHGPRASLAYLRAPGEADDPARLARYGEVAAAFLQQEPSFAQDLRPRATGDGRARDPFAAPTVSAALTARVRALLPDDWRVDVKAAPTHDGFVVGFGDAAGARHVLLAEWAEEGATAFVQGREFGFSYASGDAPDDAAVVARYREVLLALAAQEDGVVADLRAG